MLRERGRAASSQAGETCWSDVLERSRGWAPSGSGGGSVGSRVSQDEGGRASGYRCWWGRMCPCGSGSTSERLDCLRGVGNKVTAESEGGGGRGGCEERRS